MDTKKNIEKVLLVVLDLKYESDRWDADILEHELSELTTACGGEVLDVITCHISKPTASHFITKGKLEEIKMLATTGSYDTVIFSHDLKGSQQRNIEEEIQVKTIDRTQLILDIFARNATSLAGKLQVELAQLEYMLPRLSGKGIELSRLGGGIGTLGPGETKLEVDRRRISQRITHLKKGLEEVSLNRQLKRKQRKKNVVPAVTLVGYTNAGKSTLLNTLTDAKQKTKDGLFTTLDSLSRQLVLPNRQKIVLSDTVGFMHQLPHHLIESFKTTLEEVKGGDLLLHVIDVSAAHFQYMYESVNKVLKEMGVKEIPTIFVLNKVDQLDDQAWLGNTVDRFEGAVAISAKNNQGVDVLLDKIIEKLSALYVEIDVDIPIKRMDLVNLAHKEGEVYSVKYYNDRINIRASLPSHLAGKFDNPTQ